MSATVTLSVKRSDADETTWQRFDVPLRDRMTVLDALFHIVWHLDNTLSFRCACRAGMCGSCGMVVDGRERLACRTQVSDLGPTITVEPMRNLPVIKDLAVDMGQFFAKWARVTPSVRGAAVEPALIPAGSGQRARIDDHLDCISCGLCYSSCSIVASDPDYLGPAALNRAYCVVADIRDASRDERLAALGGQHGMHRCHGLFECTQVCPKGLAPTRSIAALKHMDARARVRRMWGRILGRG